MHTDANGYDLVDLCSVDGASFWRWERTGEALLWEDDRTVVFREELILILENLPGPELPSPGAFVLLLAACRGITPDLREMQARLPKDEAEVSREQTLAMSKTYRAGVELLEKLAQLPEKLRQSPVAKANLAALLPQSPTRKGAISKAELLQLLRAPQPIESPEGRRCRFGPFPWVREFAELQEAFAGLSVEAIERAAGTGLTELPKAAEVEIPLGERVRRLLKDLEQESEFSALAALTREVMAALLLPRALPRLDFETPGGFSDIGNRGPLHRLLISELAHDDDTLAARIALNEALYLRREPAALPPPATLAIVLDAGLRMWGTPRVLAAAVGLAVLAKGDQYAEAATFRATPTGLAPVSLETREGLTAQLEALEICINPATALDALAQKFPDRSAKLEVLLVTHPRCLEDPELLQALGALPSGACHAATVDREGNFALALRTAGAWTAVAEARLKIESLFAENAAARRMAANPAQPAFYFEPVSPLLLPLSSPLRAVVEHVSSLYYGAEGFVGFTDDAGLWVWKGADQGARRLPFLPMPGAFVALLHSPLAGATVAVAYEAGRQQLILTTWTGSGMAQEAFKHRIVTDVSEPPVKAWVDGEVLLVGTRTRVMALNFHGRILASDSLPQGSSWVGARFVGRQAQRRSEFLTVGFDGQAIRITILTHRHLYTPGTALQIFEPTGNGELIALHVDGRFVKADTGEVVLAVPPSMAGVFEALRDGYRVVFKSSSKEKLIANLRTLKSGAYFSEETSGSGALPTPHRWSVRSKFTHAALTKTGRIALRAQKGYWVEIQFHTDRGRMCLSLERLAELSASVDEILVFSGKVKILDHDTALQTARWKTGSRAVLDARGLLHMQSVDVTIPEVSIVLAESVSLPTWSSDGLKIGPAYFTGKTENVRWQAERIDAYLQRFVASCR